MARHETRTCDACDKPKEIKLKLYLTPVSNGTRRDHSNYTAHADICDECAEKVIKIATWQKRKKMPRKPKPGRK